MIQVTDAAARNLRVLLDEKGAGPGEGLRLSVDKGGCAGLQYGMAIGAPGPGDAVVERDGVRFIVDAASASYFEGCSIDYSDDLAGAGFRVVNPNAARSCGCGTSFEPSAASAD
jgi:iron-sulfur cluster assembly protein